MLAVTGPGGRSATGIRLSYRDYTHHPAAAISGRYRGRRIRASAPAPARVSILSRAERAAPGHWAH